MLYVTTRNNRDAYTPNHPLHSSRCPEGGFYLPLRHPAFSPEELEVLLDKGFSACVAEVLNRLFGTKLNAWDVDFALGRRWARLQELPHKILVAEPWHLPGYRFSQAVQALTKLLRREDAAATDWVNIAIRAAVLFGFFSERKASGRDRADVAVLGGDFSMPMAAWYARCWGLPIGSILICCNENNAVWELFVQGQMRTGGISIPTSVPEGDVVVPEGLERLIFACGGLPETEKYLEAVRRGAVYCPADAVLARMRQGIFVSVVSSSRVDRIISGVSRSHGYRMTPAAALTYGGLLDCRAKTGLSPQVILWSEEGPEYEL